jgi:hypothetical protein
MGVAVGVGPKGVHTRMQNGTVCARADERDQEGSPAPDPRLGWWLDDGRRVCPCAVHDLWVGGVSAVWECKGSEEKGSATRISHIASCARRLSSLVRVSTGHGPRVMASQRQKKDQQPLRASHTPQHKVGREDP